MLKYILIPNDSMLKMHVMETITDQLLWRHDANACVKVVANDAVEKCILIPPDSCMLRCML